jgi:ATP-binding cassette subfamily F protein uup
VVISIIGLLAGLGLPAISGALETEQQDITQALADGHLYASDPARAAALASRSAEIDDALLQALERWELLGA